VQSALVNWVVAMKSICEIIYNVIRSNIAENVCSAVHVTGDL